MITTLTSDISLEKIMLSGQCFRIRFHDYGYDFSGDMIYQIGHNQLFSENDVSGIFDDSVDYKYIEGQMRQHGQYLSRAAEFGHGLQIIKQPLFETILSFIISQQNNISRIEGIVGTLCKRFGHFPTRDELLNYSIEDWINLGTGYRSKYLYSAVWMCTDEFMCDLRELDTTYAKIARLKTLYGVGDKVANCIALYGLQCYDAFPIDVWMKRIIDREFGGVFDLSWCREYAGVVQLYMFYYERYGRNK